MTTLAFEPIYGSLLIALAICVTVIAVVLLVTPPTENPTHRRWLIGLRLFAAAMLLLPVFRPALLRTDNRPAEAALIVAVDKSRSMTLPDGDGSDRWTTQTETWRQLADGIGDDDRTLRVRLLAYDSAARVIPAAAPDSLDIESPDGELTDLSSATAACIQAAKGQPIAGVVLMGDGTQTAPLTDTGAQRVVETLDSLGVPLWTIPIGPAGGASASRDAAIDALSESYQLFAGNKVDIQFQLRSRGLAGVNVSVRLSWIDAVGEQSEIATRDIAPSKSVEVSAVTVPIVAPPPGTYRLRVEAEKQDGELVTTNNLQTAFVDVRAGGGRILYLEGEQRLEQTFLRRSLRRFPDLDLTVRWIPSDTAASWPQDLGDALGDGEYDIFIIGDLDADAIGDRQLKELANAVSKGAALVTLGGFQAYGAGGYASSPLASVLPIKMDGSRRRNVGARRPDSPADQIAGPVQLRLSRRHPITDLGGDSPAAIWQQLPPQQGANRLISPKVAPGVETLLESPNQEPMLVIGQYGRGRTASLAFDSTYRWWRAKKSDAHRRFWRQLVLWMLAREETGGDKIAIEMDARRYSIDNPPEFRATLESLSDTISDVELAAEIIDESDKVIPLTVSTESRSEQSTASPRIAIRGRVPELPTGFYRLRVSPKETSDSVDAQEMAFQVIDESRELELPMADPIYLRQLAELTSDHGGAAFAPDEVDTLIDAIRQRRRKAETPVVEKNRLGDGPVSGWLLFALFAGTISTEWFLRRKWGLV